MRYHCYGCGKSVTSELPEDSVIRAVLACPECIEANEDLVESLTKQNAYKDVLLKAQGERIKKRFTPVEKEQLVEMANAALKGLPESHCFVGVFDDKPLDASRVEFLMQLGFSILSDKKIMIPIPMGAMMPVKLAAVADEIVWFDPNNLKTLELGIRRVLEQWGKEA